MSNITSEEKRSCRPQVPFWRGAGCSSVPPLDCHWRSVVAGALRNRERSIQRMMSSSRMTVLSQIGAHAWTRVYACDHPRSSLSRSVSFVRHCCDRAADPGRSDGGLPRLPHGVGMGPCPGPGRAREPAGIHKPHALLCTDLTRCASRDFPMLRLSLVYGGHIRGVPRASRRRDAAAMVRPCHRAKSRRHSSACSPSSLCGGPKPRSRFSSHPRSAVW
jgi:hypothetical protein